MKTMTRQRRAAFWLGLLLLMILAIKGLIVVSQFIGYASFDSEAGTITQIILRHELPTEFWAAVFGVAVRVPGYSNQQYEDLTAGDLEESNLLFDCMERDIEHEVYATEDDPASLDLSNLFAITVAELDAYYGRNPSDFDSFVNTFTQAISFQYGTTTVNTVGTVSYKLGENPPTTFRMAAAKLGDGTPVLVSLITNFTDGYNGRLYNYQLMLPTVVNTSTRYYFWTDPNDVCPGGEGEEPNQGGVYGTVTTTTGVPIPGVIVEVAGVTNITDVDGNYSLTTDQGTHNIYAIKEGFYVYENNVTVPVNNRTRHDIILEEITIPNTNTGIGPGQDNPGDNVGPAQQEGVGPGQDVGPGEAPLVPFVQQPKVIEGQDYIISLTELNRRLRLDQFVQERIYIYNFRKTSVTVTLAINGTNISRLITVDKNELVVDANGKGEFVLTIFGVGDTGIFNGTIDLDGDINASIPVRIEILPREQLPIEALHIEIETAEKRYYPNDLVRVKTDLRNMLIDQQYPVRLFFTVQNPEGDETIWSYETNVHLKTAFSLINNFKLQSGVKSGDYILRVSATYLGLSSGTSTIFHVAVPFWQRSLFGMKYWLWFLILALLAAGVGAFFYIRKQIEAKKKYHLKVDYDELPKPGPRSIYVGKIAETDKTTYFNLENFKTHTIVAGSTGGGKSVSAQVIIEEALEKDIAVIVFDPTAQWTGMLRPCKDKTMLALYPLYGMKRTDAKAFPGNIRQINNPREKIDIRKYAKPGEIQVFCGHKLDPKDMDTMVANAIREIFHASFPENRLLKIFFVFDEVHRLLPKFGGSGDGFLQIERGCREFRKWGLGIMLISQVLSDFVGTIKANINTEIQMRTRDEGDLERIRQKYGEDVLRSLVKATVGTGMVENPAYNRGQPYFVGFKPLKHSVERLTDEEIEQYNEYNDRIDNLYYSLEQLEGLKVDVFDLKLELKLALDKVKTGNFNMVKIYLEGLEPRIAKNWEKLGKKPKQMERELVDMSEIQEELKKAQAERDKAVAAEQKSSAAAAGPAEKKDWGWKDDVPPDKILNLKNGMIVINLSSLYDEVSAMKDADLPKEFLPEPPEPEEGEEPKQPINRFAEWVVNATGDTKLGYALAACTKKEELVALLEKKKEGQEIPEAKPPAWFLKQAGAAVTEGKEVAKAPPAQAAKAEAAPVAESQAPAAEKPAAQPPPVKPRPVQPAPSSLAPAQQTPAKPASPKPAARPPQPVRSGESTVMEVGQPEGGAQIGTVMEAGKAEGGVTGPEPTWVVKGGATILNRPREEESARGQQGHQPVAGAKAGGSIDDLVVHDESQAFRLDNGMVIHGVKELKEYLPQMSDAEFSKHVGLDYNHFADWISGVFKDEELARKVGTAQNKEEMVAALSN